MPKKRKSRKPAHRPRGRGTTGPRRRDEPELITDVRRMLTEDHPLELLGYASSLLAVVVPRNDPFPTQDEPDGPDLATLIDSFAGVELVETSALLAAIAELVPDELLAKRLRRVVADRAHPLPTWLTDLAPLTVTGAAESSHVLGDGDNVMVGARTAAGHDLTALVYIDHNLGTLVKDAFVVPAPLDELADDFAEASGHDPGVCTRDLPLADARTRIGEAVELWSMTYPPLETETWPACRPLVHWMLRHLPEGGRGYERPEWNDADRAALTERFFASEFGRGHDDEDRQLFESLLWFGCDYGPGDPLRWSPVAVEILLSDWLPRKVIADAAFLSRAPALLRSLIRYSHAERGISPPLTEETLDAVDAWEPEYQQTIRSDRPQGPAALLAAMGLPIEGAFDDLPDYGALMRDILSGAVGGEEALRTLDAELLPDEPFDWSVVPDDVRGRVGETLELVDSCCAALLDVECRTASRRLLADIVAGDAEVFRRRGRADTAAAAIVWIVAKANDLLSYQGLTAKELHAWFGLTGSASQRAGALLKAAGIEGADAYDMRLGTPRYLVSSRRRSIIDSRDRYGARHG